MSVERVDVAERYRFVWGTGQKQQTTCHTVQFRVALLRLADSGAWLILAVLRAMGKRL